MQYIPNILFLIVLFLGIGFFIKSCKKIIRNIKLGQKVDISDHKKTRWNNVFRIAFGQSKMVARPLSGFLHIIVYIGFVVINIEVLEIIIDGLFGTHQYHLKIQYNICIIFWPTFHLWRPKPLNFFKISSNPKYDHTNQN